MIKPQNDAQSLSATCRTFLCEVLGWMVFSKMPTGPRMYMSQEKHVTHNDFEEIKEKVDWVEIHGAAAVTRKTMWFVKEGCRRAMAGLMREQNAKGLSIRA